MFTSSLLVSLSELSSASRRKNLTFRLPPHSAEAQAVVRQQFTWSKQELWAPKQQQPSRHCVYYEIIYYLRSYSSEKSLRGEKLDTQRGCLESTGRGGRKTFRLCSRSRSLAWHNENSILCVCSLSENNLLVASPFPPSRTKNCFTRTLWWLRQLQPLKLSSTRLIIPNSRGCEGVEGRVFALSSHFPDDENIVTLAENCCQVSPTDTPSSY
jgi:hypothetical protein